MTRLVYCPGVCRECGCTDEAPCEEGCSWIEPDLCSACCDGAADPEELGPGGDLLLP